ncbi:MAG: hypothetical protein C0614_11560 [Desulfuromonas sp.]|nr:MAG: hypothetical protein C0614_11560 [Desulfuromonas sp.]
MGHFTRQLKKEENDFQQLQEGYVNFMKRFLFLFTVALCLLSGCAKKQPEKIVWPPPPDTPRLEFIGNFYSKKDFPQTPGMVALRRFIIGDVADFALTSPFGIASDGEGKVFISDIHAKTVHIFDFNEQKISRIGGAGTFDLPLGLAIDSNKNIYVADGSRNVVMVFSSDKEPLFSFGHDILKKASYLALDEERNRIYASDAIANKVRVFNMGGEHLFDIGLGRGNADGAFHAPQGLGVASNGNLYVADMFNARIEYFSPDGEFIGKFGERGDRIDQLDNPKDVAFDSEGNLYIIDSRAARLSIYTQTGQLLLTLGGGHTGHRLGFAAPKSVSIDKNDRIYVAEVTNKRFTIWQYYSKKYLEKAPQP